MKLAIALIIITSNIIFSQNDSLNYYLLNSDYDKAIVLGEKIIKKNNINEKVYIKTAHAYSTNYNFSKALNTLEKAELLYPTNNNILFSKANILYKSNRLNKSTTTINNLLKADSLNRKYLLLAMKIANAKNKYKSSLKYNNKLLFTDSTNAVFNYMAGKTSVKLKQNKEAILYFEKAIIYDSTYSDAYNWLAKVHDAYKNWDTSLYYINMAISIEPDNIIYYKQRANTNYDRTHYFRALIDFEKVLEADTNSRKISFQLGVCYQQINKHDKAHKLFLKSYSIDSTNYKINQYLGMSYYHLKQYDKAVHYIETAQKLIQPDKNIETVLQSQLAINYFNNKQYNKAIEYNKIMKQKRSRNYWYNYYIAESYYNLNNFRKAKKYYTSIDHTLPLEFEENKNAHLIIINEHLFLNNKN